MFFLCWQGSLLTVNVIVIVVMICVSILPCRPARTALPVLLDLSLPGCRSASLSLHVSVLSWWLLVDFALTLFILCLRCMLEIKATLEWIIKKCYHVVHGFFNLKKCLNLEIVYWKKTLPRKYFTLFLHYDIDMDVTLLSTSSVASLPSVFGTDYCSLRWELEVGCVLRPCHTKTIDLYASEFHVVPSRYNWISVN